MKIDSSTNPIGNSAIREEPGRALKKSPDESKAPPQSTSVHLTPLSAQLQSIQKGLADTPVIDAARVAELKEAISSGHFKVDADKIADRLLQTVQELIAAHKR